jgi:tetratricopeptide (TPR) repeat protein
MRPKTKQNARLMLYLTLCSIPLACGSSVLAQSMASRVAANTRYGNALQGNEVDLVGPLAGIVSEPAIGPPMLPPTKTVSVQELLVPSKAVKEFERSLKAAQSGDFQSAAEHLQKAIRIDPDFAEAHNNLGASYIGLNQYERAISEFQLSIALDSKIAETHRNLGLGLFLLRRYAEAELAARRALELDPQRNTARYTLGRILAAEGGSSTEAEHLLRQSMADFPDARLPLAQVLLNKGANERAADELRIYLQSPGANPAVKQAVQCWVAKISGTDQKVACRRR